MVEPLLGDKIPISLVVPVTLDCFTDGFLIGVSVSISPSAGIVLGIANCLEMSFLGEFYFKKLLFYMFICLLRSLLIYVCYVNYH